MTDFFFKRERGPRLLRGAPDARVALRRIAALVQREGLLALRAARNPLETPKESGQLIRSISWTGITRTIGSFQGQLRVGVEYGRRQEFEHLSKSRYLFRAIAAAHLRLGTVLASDRILREMDLRVVR